LPVIGRKVVYCLHRWNYPALHKWRVKENNCRHIYKRFRSS